MIAGLLVVLLLQGLADGRYGFFRDELYYLSNARSLAWGYVDHPPLAVWVLRAWISVFGDGVESVRALSLVISLGSVLAMGALTRELYDDDGTVCLACLAVAAMPVLRVVGTLYSPNTLEMPLWAVSILIWVRCCRCPRSSWRPWGLLGLALGLCILNRLSGLWLCAALVAATVTQFIRASGVEAKRGFVGAHADESAGHSANEFAHSTLGRVWVAPIVVLIVISPWILWERETGWPTVEFARNANAHKLLPVPPWQFVATQLVVTNPVVAVLWIAALWKGWRDRFDRALAAGFVCVALILIVNGRSRENYLAPAYAFVLPVGAHLLRRQARWLAPAMAVTGVAFGFICLPILPAPVLARILAAFPSPPSVEKGPKSVLQGLSDTMGWREMTRDVARVWSALPDRGSVAVMADNYGEASALEYYGSGYGVPKPICADNQFWLDGFGSWDGRSVLYLGVPSPALLGAFSSVRRVGQVDAPWAVPAEAHAGIWLLTGGRLAPEVLWDRLKRFE